MHDIKKAIEKVLVNKLSSSNIERIKYDNNEYQETLDILLNYILEVEYQNIIDFLNKNCIDNNHNIAKCSKELLGIYLSNKTPYSNFSKSIKNKNQKEIFWDLEGELFKYNSEFPIYNIQKFNENIIIFFRSKKSDKLPLAIVVNLIGEIIFSIDYPTKDFCQCVNEDIEFYGGGVDVEKMEMGATFMGGACRFDFFCDYDLNNREYIYWNQTK